MNSMAGGCGKRQYLFSSNLRRRQVWFGKVDSPGRRLPGFKGYFCQGRPHTAPSPPQSTAARKQGCHGAALALFQSILTLKDWGPCSFAVPTMEGPPPPRRQRRAEPSSPVLGLAAPTKPTLFAVLRDRVAAGTGTPGRAHQQLLVCALAWQGDGCLTARLPMGS